jgi:cell division transport system permease protein
VAFVCLASALLVVENISGLRDRWAHAGRASVYLKPGADADAIRRIETALRATPGVATVRHVSSEEAREELIGAGDEAIRALPADAFPASLEVRLVDDTDQSRIGALEGTLGKLPEVESVETYENWTERLAGLLEGGVTAASLLALIVLTAVGSVVGSTMRLSLARRRTEVEVLKVVGATDGYVRRPFLIEGAAQGAIGASLAVALLFGLFLIMKVNLHSDLALLIGMTPRFLPWSMVTGMVAMGALLGLTAAHLSLRKLLSV